MFDDKIQRWLCKDCGHRFSDQNDVQNAKNAVEFVGTVETQSLKSAVGIVASNQICVTETKNLEAEQQTNNVPRRNEQESRGKIIEHGFWMQKEGYAESTISRRIRLLGTLVNKGANLQDPESVKETIAKQANWATKTKEIAVETYDCFIKMQGKTWSKPIYQSVRKLPFIPTEEELNNLIAGCNRKTATFLQLLKETGMRCGEAFMLQWTDFDFENKTVNITPEKGSDPRQLRISMRLVMMLNSLPHDKAKPFDCSHRHFSRTFRVQRTKIANKLKNDRILKIHFHTLRHWKATMEYAKTKDILHVMKMLGHRNIQNTLLYTQLISFESDQFHSATAKTVQDAQKLIEAGFEYVCEFNEVKIFKKRK
jgi:integrase